MPKAPTNRRPNTSTKDRQAHAKPARHQRFKNRQGSAEAGREPSPKRADAQAGKSAVPGKAPARKFDGKPPVAKPSRPFAAKPGRPAAPKSGRPAAAATGKPAAKPGLPASAKSDKPASAKPDKAVRKPLAKTRQRRSRDAEPVAGPNEPMRIAKAMARAGLCSRRDAERWIAEGRVRLNGKLLDSPAVTVTTADTVLVDGQPLPAAEPVRLWRYHKPKGLVTTHKDPEGRPTVFDNLPDDLPRVVSVGRLDFNTEGLLLLTNDGALARHLELPSTGWLRRYRVRAHGRVTAEQLAKLGEGVEIEGIRYGPVEATLDSVQGANVWLTLGLREGKNREVRKILASLGLDVNRLIRISYGPFQLLDLPPRTADPVKRRVLADQLGAKLTEEFGLKDAPDPQRLGSGRPSDRHSHGGAHGGAPGGAPEPKRRGQP